MRTIASWVPIAARMAKDNLRAAYAMGREEAIRYERELQTICFAAEDATKGHRAFAKERAPQFRGWWPEWLALGLPESTSA